MDEGKTFDVLYLDFSKAFDKMTRRWRWKYKRKKTQRDSNRPKLEYGFGAWCPWLESDIKTLEKVQEREVQMIADKRGATYAERLKSVGLTSLRERRNRGVAIETFKMIKEICVSTSTSLSAKMQCWRGFRSTKTATNRTTKKADSDMMLGEFWIPNL